MAPHLDIMPQPGEEPDGSEDDTATVTINIPVPYTEGDVYVEVWQDDMRMVADTYSGNIGSFPFVATGSGAEKISVYCGGVLTYTTVVDFSLYD